MRLAPEVGGRVLTLDVKEGDRVEPGQIVLTLDTRDVELAIQRAKAEQAAGRGAAAPGAAGARPEDVRQAEVAGRRPPAPTSAAASPSSTPPSRTSSASRRCSRATPAREAARRCGDAAGRGEGPRVAGGEPREVRGRNAARACAPAPGREEIDAARARVAVVGAQIAIARKEPDRHHADVAGRRHRHREAGRGRRGDRAPRAGRRRRRPRSRVGGRVRARAGGAAHQIGQPATVFTDAGGAGIDRHRSPTSRRRRSSRRATCRRRRSDRSSSTASASPSTTRTAC